MLAAASLLLPATPALLPSACAAQFSGPTLFAGPAETESLLALVADPAAPAASRDAAAEALLLSAGRRHISTALTQILAPGSDAPGRNILIGALARSADPPASLLRPLLTLAESARAEDIPPLLVAIGSFRERDAAEFLVEHAAAQDPAVSAAATAALVRMTGRADIGGDAAAWKAWLQSTSRLSTSEWRSSLTAGIVAHADRLAAERAELIDRLVDTSRRLYLAAPQQERGPLTAGFLLDARDELRALGFELVARELSAGARSLDPVIGEAAVRLLEHAHPTTRARAALLLNQLAPSGAATAVIAALAREQNPEVAATLLSAASRWPGTDLIEPALRWLEAGPPSRAPAMDVLIILRRAGLLDDPAHHDRILTALRAIEPQRLRLSACRLLVALGSDEDRARVAALLDHEVAAVRLAAADALAERPEMVDRLLAAAAADPALFEQAARAVAVHRPTAAGYRALAATNAATPEAYRDGLLVVADKLSDADVIAVARDIRPDAEFREAVLARLARRTLQNGDEAGPECVEGLMLLAETRLALGRPDAALLALDAIPEGTPVDPAPADALRATALVWTNRLEEAQELDTPASSWLDGLENAVAEPYARAIVDAIQDRFAGRLTSEETGRLEMLIDRIAEAERLEEGASKTADAESETEPG